MPDDGAAAAPVFWLTVSQITRTIKETLERTIGHVWVMGELSGVKLHQPSGHLYFGVKDAESQLRGVMFRRRASSLAFAPVDGDMVLAYGLITVFERQGHYQLVVEEMVPGGAKGLEAVKLEMLKAKLSQEGLFDSDRKRILPRFPAVLGVVTSPTGAAIADIIKVATRRWPAVRIVVAPAVVQGDAAPASLVQAIDALNASGLPDVMIVGRGGGGREDLSCFNDESVVRALARSRVPVVSAVGHETDITLADLVADARAPTPSAAAELAVPDRRELVQQVASIARRAERALSAKAALLSERLRRLGTSHGLRSTRHVVQQRSVRLDELSSRMRATTAASLALQRRAFLAQENRLGALDPRAVLRRGYTMCLEHESRKLVTSATRMAPSHTVDVVFHDGEVPCQVLQIPSA